MLDQFQKTAGVERRHEYEFCASIECAKHAHDRTAGVEERICEQPTCVVGNRNTMRPESSIVDDAVVPQHRALRKPSCAAGVLDQHRVVGADGRQFEFARLYWLQHLCQQIEAQHAAQLRQFGTDALDVCDKWIAADVGYREYPNGPRLTQDVLQLGGLQARIHRHQSQSRERDAVLEHYPLG